MGVRFLETYLERESRGGACNRVDISSLVTQYRNETGLTPVVVIDGMSCLRPLYGKLSWLNGGQFKEFCDIVQKFINNFTRLGCELVVFFDGPVQTVKLPVWKKRRLDSGMDISNLLETFNSPHVNTDSIENSTRTSILPNGLGYIFCYLFSQHPNCQVFKTLKECDEEVASYASENNCFAILAQDTDYVIYGAGHYYLSIRHLDLDKMTTLCYSGWLLSKELGFPHDKLPLFASLLGNDIVVYELLISFHNKLKRNSNSKYIVPLVANYVRKWGFQNTYRISDYVFGSTEQMSLLNDSMKSYDLSHMKQSKTNSQEESSSSNKKWSEIVDFLKEIYVKSSYAPPLYDIIIRSEFYSSTCLESYKPDKIILPIGNYLKELRRAIYGILLYEKPVEDVSKENLISELVMTGFKSMENAVLVNPKYLTKVKHPGLLPLFNSQDKDIEERRWEILGEIFECDPVSMRCLPQWILVPALATRYFRSQFSGAAEWELDALLASNVCSRKYSSQDLSKLPSGPLTYRSIWIFSAVNRTYAAVGQVIFILGNPIPMEYTQPFHYADGKLFQEKYRQSRNKASHTELCDHQMENLKLFNTVKSFVMT